MKDDCLGDLCDATIPEANLIEAAMVDLVNMECPHCHEYLDLPSLEDIREWLKEEK